MNTNTELKDWQKHIQHTRQDIKDQSWCGVKLNQFDWTFTSLDHAAYAIDSSTTMPCPACLKAAAAKLSEGFKE